MSNNHQHLSRTKLRFLFLSVIITCSGLLVSWWLYDKIYSLYGVKPVIVDEFTDLFRLILGLFILIVTVYMNAMYNTKQQKIS